MIASTNVMDKKQRKIIIAANWKMNQTRTSTAQFFQQFQKSDYRVLSASAGSLLNVVIFPQPLLLNECIKHLENNPLDSVFLGSQNTYLQKTGAFTGETSPELAKECGAEFALIGHSERRTLFGESNQNSVDRAIAALKSNLEVIFCIGETFAQKQAGQTETTIFEQLTPFFETTNPEALSIWKTALETQKFHIAYEPVWAIGTGRTPTAAEANLVQEWIRRILVQNGSPKAKYTSILYGGSVKPENASGFLAMPEIDGLLVGGASLEVAQFYPLICAGTEIRRSLSL